MLHIPTCGHRLFILLSTVCRGCSLAYILHVWYVLVFISVMLSGRLAAFAPSLTTRSLDYWTLHLTLRYRSWPFMLSMPYQTTSPSWGQLSLFQPCPAVLSLPSGFARCGYPPELLLLKVSPGYAVCTGAPVDSCVLLVSSGALEGTPTLWVLWGYMSCIPSFPSS